MLTRKQYELLRFINERLKEAGVPPSFDEMKEALEEAGVIKGYAAQLDAKSVGLSVNVFMSVSLSTQVEKALKDFERAAAERPEVMECYLMTGDSDYLLRVVVPDLEAYERFVMDFTKIAGIAQIRSSFALRPVKQGTALPLSVSGR